MVPELSLGFKYEGADSDGISINPNYLNNLNPLTKISNNRTYGEKKIVKKYEELPVSNHSSFTINNFTGIFLGLYDTG